MAKSQPPAQADLETPNVDPEKMGAQFWYAQYLKREEENGAWGAVER